ncbi:MAG: Hpt domain-containing protein, partial [Methylomonas sp.]
HAALPIIAMTAAVQERERSECYAAGMTDHISKPVLPETLIAALIRCIKPLNQPGSVVSVSPAGNAAASLPADLPGFDLAYISAAIGSDCQKLRHLCELFKEKFSGSSERLRDLLGDGKADQACEWLHNLKGAAGIIGAVELSQAADRLERRLSKGEPAEDSQSALERCLAATLQTIASLTDSIATAETEGNDSDWAAAGELAGQLRILLDGSDFVPHELISQLKNALTGQDTRQLLLQIEKQVGNIDYVQARDKLADLEAIIGLHLQREFS